MISDERLAELEPWSIRVYQQLQAGFSVDAIKSQFDRIDGADPEEVAWVLSTGKQRYLGYWKFRENEEANYTNEFTVIGLAAIGLFGAITYFSGWPDHGKGRRVLGSLLLGGLMATAYGVWTAISSKPEAVRTDLDKL